MQPELPFLGVLPQEKTDTIMRGERVEILPAEATRFMLAMDERKVRQIAELKAELKGLLEDQARLGALLHQVAGILGVEPINGAIEEEPLLKAARALATIRNLQDASIGMLERLGEEGR
jgi:hypothetical protein